jgi:presenilin-like A22 family membrane protease
MISFQKDDMVGIHFPDGIHNPVVKRSKLRIQLAILGGGDVVFPLIAAGVFMKFFGFIPALCVVLFSTLALLYIYIFARKNRYTPAMPYLAAGIFLGMLVTSFGWV